MIKTKTRNISLTKELDDKTLQLIEELKSLGYDRCYSSIVRESLMLSIDLIRQQYTEIVKRRKNV